MNDFVRERNEALLSLDKEKILAYLKKYNPAYKIPQNEKDFWAGVHKAICNLFLIEENHISLEQFDRSYVWLQENGYSPSIK